MAEIKDLYLGYDTIALEWRRLSPQAIKFNQQSDSDHGSPFADSPPPLTHAPQETLYLFADRGQLSDLEAELTLLSDQVQMKAIYEQPVFNHLKLISPYLIEASPVVQTWFYTHNVPTAGFFFCSSWSIDILHQHFQQFIQMLKPCGERLFLKMAHSEVALALLQQATSSFGHPITKAWLPTRLGWKTLSISDDSQILTRPRYPGTSPLS